MEEHRRLSPVDFLINGPKEWIARPFIAGVGEHHDAIRLQRVERVFDLFEGQIHIGHGAERRSVRSGLGLSLATFAP